VIVTGRASKRGNPSWEILAKACGVHWRAPHHWPRRPAAHAKDVMRIELTDRLEGFGRGKGGFWEDRGYEWCAGI
jgi:hypothetical protein